MFTKKRSKAIIAMLLAIVLVAVTAPAFFAQDSALGTSGEENLSGVPNSNIINTLQLGRSGPAYSPGTVSQTERDIVLVLDTSGSMGTTPGAPVNPPHYKPIDFLKDATTAFVEQAFVKAPKSRIGIVRFSTSASIASPFKDATGEAELLTAIDGLYASGSTNYESGLKAAFDMFYASGTGTAKGVKKVIVFMSDGEVNGGAQGKVLTDLTTRYHLIYNIDIYTLGFFHSVNQSTISALAKLLTDMNGGKLGRYFQVENPNDLMIIFGDLLENLTNESPIILVPDAFGSTLYSDLAKTSAVWPRSTMDETELRTAFAMSKKLYFSDLVHVNASSSGATEYGANDQYKALLDSFITEFTDRPIYFLNYDFRKSSAENAELLEDAVFDIVEIQKLSPTVDIVAHGQGALIASHYAAKDWTTDHQDVVNPTGVPAEFQRSTVDLTNAIVSVAAPFEGAPSILQAAMTGIPATLGALDNTPSVLEAMPRDLIAQFPGIAEQFPTNAYFTTYPFYTQGAFNGSSFDKEPMSLAAYNAILDDYFDGTIAADARATQQLLASNRLMDVERKPFFNYGNYNMTAFRPVFKTTAGVTSVVDMVFLSVGDTVVPKYSADYLSQLRFPAVPYRNRRVVNLTYGELLNDRDSTEWMTYVLRLVTDEPEIPINPSTGKPYVILRIACPVDIAITNSNGDTLSNIGTRSIKGFGAIYMLGDNSDIKIAVIDEEFASNLTIDIDATDTGTMDYSITYVDNATDPDAVKLEERAIAGIPLLASTRITANSNRASTVLKTDYWGDGRYLDIVHNQPVPAMLEKDPALPPVIHPPIVTPPIKTSTYTPDTTGSTRADVATTLAKTSAKEFSTADAKALFEAAQKANASATALTLKAYNYDTVAAAALQELAKLAKAANVNATIYFDTVVDNKVTRRVKVVPAADATALSLVNTGTVSTLQARLEKSHTNAVQVIGFSQLTPFTGTTEVALVLDSKLGKDLVFYSYDAAANTYKAIDLEYRIDNNSYVHFKTDMNTTIIISDGPLTK